MAARKRSSKRRQSLSSAAQAWLRGEPCGFFMLKHQGELEAVWEEYGDKANMFWRSRYCLPTTRAELEEHEEAWLNGSCGHFVDRHYTDDEKQTLWSERGDRKRQPGTRVPEPI
jgi:hypothetical protein